MKYLINNLMVGKLEAVINYDHSCILLSLEVNRSYQHRGIGSKLLLKLIEHCRLSSIRAILLDDMSDGFETSNNIYVKHGFKYINKHFLK